MKANFIKYVTTTPYHLSLNDFVKREVQTVQQELNGTEGNII